MANRYEYTKRNDTCPTSSTTLYCRQSNKIKHTLKKKTYRFWQSRNIDEHFLQVRKKVLNILKLLLMSKEKSYL